MTFTLNPDTNDAYESKTLAQMRQMVYDRLGFIDPLSITRAGISRGVSYPFKRNLGDIRVSIINRLGLAVALLASTDTIDNIYTQVYNATGYAGQSSAPPGVQSMIFAAINEAHRTLFARIEFDKGGATQPAELTTGQSTKIDGTAVRQLAIALVKAHKGQADAQAYFAQSETYLKNLVERSPPNIIGQVNAAIVAANDTALDRYEMGNTGVFNSVFGSALITTDNFAQTASDTDVPDASDTIVETLALANLKQKIGQPDAKALFDQYERAVTDQMKRVPPNARTIVNRALKDTQDTLYRSYKVFRDERWYTWSLVAGQRFYGTFSDDNARSIAPTGLTATIGAAVTAHNMSVPHQDAVVVLLPNGKVLVAGGSNSVASQTDVADVFDPATGQFSATGSMAFKRTFATGTLMPDNRVLVCGGSNGNSIFSSCEIYNPSTGTFGAGPSMTGKRFAHTATQLQDGKILVCGGASAILSVSPFVTVIATCELFDPATGTFAPVGNLATARENHTATLLPDGRVLIAGGGDATLTAVNSTEIYDPVAKTFSAGPAMVKKRFSHTATLMDDGTVLIAGGQDETSTHLNTAETFNANGTFTATTNTMSATRSFGFAALLESGKAFVGGGAFPAGTGDIYDPASRAFTVTTGSLPVPLISTFAVTLANGKVLIPGGSNANTLVTYNTAILFDPGSQLFAYTGSLTQGTVYYQVAAETANGSSVPGAEASVSGVPLNTAVDLEWTPMPNQPFVVSFAIYGRGAGGAKQFIARVPASQTTYTDDGTIPPDGAMPTVNATAGPGALDPREITWVGLSINGIAWRPLIKSVPPETYNNIQQGIPEFYNIASAIELWPTPSMSTYQLQIKGFFKPFTFENDDDYTTIDWQAIYLQTVADLKVYFKQPDASVAEARASAYIGDLVAGSHMTQRFVPNQPRPTAAVMPVLKT